MPHWLAEWRNLLSLPWPDVAQIPDLAVVGPGVRTKALSPDLVVALPHHPKRVLVEAEPDVQAVLQDEPFLAAHGRRLIPMRWSSADSLRSLGRVLAPRSGGSPCTRRTG